MAGAVLFAEAFATEFENLAPTVQGERLARAGSLRRFGSRLGRPHVDTLAGFVFAARKELRCVAGKGVWRAAFALGRSAILLVTEDKAGVGSARSHRVSSPGQVGDVRRLWPV